MCSFMYNKPTNHRRLVLQLIILSPIMSDWLGDLACEHPYSLSAMHLDIMVTVIQYSTITDQSMFLTSPLVTSSV